MNSELEREIRAEAEATRDAPLPAASGERPNRNRSTVYSVRLTLDEMAAVQAAADRAGLPASTLVRSWIVERAKAAVEQPADPDAKLRALIHDEVRAAVHEALAS
jgi:hypothetical protein